MAAFGSLNAEGFPERATFECERKQSRDGCTHGDHHEANAFNPRIRKSTLQRLSLFAHLNALATIISRRHLIQP